jgi:hypothetical protein
MEERMDEDEPLLPLDERFRQAVQLTFDLVTPKQSQPLPTDYVKGSTVCINNCNVCKDCDNN